MRTIVLFLLSQSILLPIIAGLVRWRRIDVRYRPFFILLVIGFLTEVVSFTLIRGLHTGNGIVVNIYILIEWIMIAWQFHVWGLMKQRPQPFRIFVGLVCLLWVGEYFVFGHLRDFSPYFRCTYYFLIVLMSINNINFLITHDNRSLIRNPRFLICIGFLIYFVFMILEYWAYQVSRYNDKSTLATTFVYVMSYINVGTNVIYAIAFLLIPPRVKFTFDPAVQETGKSRDTGNRDTGNKE